MQGNATGRKVVSQYRHSNGVTIRLPDPLHILTEVVMSPTYVPSN